MKILIVQLALILGVALAVLRLLRSHSVRGQAVRRLAAIVFVLMATLSILFPASWTALANLVGVGRGTDMVLYALVIAFLSYTVTSYGRTRELESMVTSLVRHEALRTAPPLVAGPAVEETAAPAVPAPRTPGNGPGRPRPRSGAPKGVATLPP